MTWLLAQYDSRKSNAEARVAEWHLSSDQVFDPRPLYFESHRCVKRNRRWPKISANVAESIVEGTILVGGGITAVAAIGLNVVFVRYVTGRRRASRADRTARAIGTLTFVQPSLRFALVTWVGLEILFLGLVFDGKPGWILTIPLAMLIWTAATMEYLARLLRRLPGQS